MVFWIAAFLIAAAVVLPLVLALRGARDQAHTGALSDVAVYRDQLAEVERDLARGVLTDAEAEAVRTEVSRRLLEADRRAEAEGAETAGSLWPGVLLVVAVIGAGAYGLYTRIGAPGYPDLPMAERIAALDAAAAARPSQMDAEAETAQNMPPIPEADPAFLELMEKLRETLKDRPDDVRGLALLAENEARLGNFIAAREAQDRLLAVKGDQSTAVDLVMAMDIMVFAAGGYVSPEAELVLRRLLATDPENGAGRYYAGLTLAQNGRPDQAFPIWRRLLETGPPNAPWVPIIRSEIMGVAAAAGVDYAPPPVAGQPVLPGPDADTVAAANDMTPEERQDMIRGMVEGLAARLANDGGPPEEWARLIVALGVLGDVERAGAIVSEARDVFADSNAALQVIEDAASQAGLTR